MSAGAKTGHRAPREETVAAIEMVVIGGTFFPDRIIKWIEERESRSSLSAREIEILEMVAKGLTNKEIAGALDISFYTVRNHVNHISAKLQMADRTEAATVAIRQGIIGGG